MMDQITFAEAEFDHKKRKTRRELFLERMDKLIPWEKLQRKIVCLSGFSPSLKKTVIL